MKYSTTQFGFSLVETLVAITILLIFIVGPLSIGTLTARSTNFSSDQVTAFFLAQEGAELVQMARDNYLLADFANPNAAWGDFTDTSGTLGLCFSSNGCGLESQSDANGLTGELKAAVNCTSNGAGCKLYYDEDGGPTRFTYQSGGNEDTIFTRIIRIADVDGSSVKVTSRVTWRAGFLRDEQAVEAETYLYNIFETP